MDVSFSKIKLLSSKSYKYQLLERLLVFLV